ncbi:hypothetical protein [Pelosinus fermentans]|uniref:hypothetical protein n=1 Tax=Pelosinus fermentans TaxID=365349 RepID=UPI0011846D7F|nr:hypothetical protein [Pelosinus fermentans]
MLALTLFSSVHHPSVFSFTFTNLSPNLDHSLSRSAASGDSTPGFMQGKRLTFLSFVGDAGTVVGDAGTVESSYQPFSTIPYLLRLDIANDKLRPFRFIPLYSNALFYRINRFKSHCI